MATITLGRPQGQHGPVRRRPLPELVYGERWGRGTRLGGGPARGRAHRGGTAERRANRVWVLRTPLAEG